MSKFITINMALAMEKSLRSRLSQLEELKTQSAKRSFFENDKVKEEPTYDIKKVDKKITAINKALFELNHKVKESNAKTSVEVEADYDQLVSELE